MTKLQATGHKKDWWIHEEARTLAQRMKITPQKAEREDPSHVTASMSGHKNRILNPQ